VPNLTLPFFPFLFFDIDVVGVIADDDISSGASGSKFLINSPTFIERFKAFMSTSGGWSVLGSWSFEGFVLRDVDGGAFDDDRGALGFVGDGISRI